jgi:IMP dehydrogenase/GMP reductase
MKPIELSLGFKDVSIKQKKNICKSRLDVNIESEIIRGVKRPIPLVAANMSTVINSDFYIQLYNAGAFGVLHRALSENEYLREVKEVSRHCGWVASSIGVGENQKELCKNLIGFGSNIIVIDIAHGYAEVVIEMAKWIKQKYSTNIKVVVGNTTNPDMLEEVADYIDAIKIGIGIGSNCETKDTAGCTAGQFTTIYSFQDKCKKYGIPIISDGGITKPSDFTKAIAAGANSVMAGRIFARCPESAAKIRDEKGVAKKVYSGMSSRDVQEEWRGGLKEGTCPEGKTTLLDLGESLTHLLERYSGALKSGITYAGANDIASLHENAEFIRMV